MAAIASNACTDSQPHGVNVTSTQNVRKCLPFQLKSQCKVLHIVYLVIGPNSLTKLIPDSYLGINPAKVKHSRCFVPESLQL